MELALSLRYDIVASAEELMEIHLQLDHNLERGVVPISKFIKTFGHILFGSGGTKNPKISRGDIETLYRFGIIVFETDVYSTKAFVMNHLYFRSLVSDTDDDDFVEPESWKTIPEPSTPPAYPAVYNPNNVPDASTRQRRKYVRKKPLAPRKATPRKAPATTKVRKIVNANAAAYANAVIHGHFEIPSLKSPSPPPLVVTTTTSDSKANTPVISPPVKIESTPKAPPPSPEQVAFAQFFGPVSAAAAAVPVIDPISMFEIEEFSKIVDGPII